MADVARVEIEQDEVGWVLRVLNPGMKAQEYRCATKAQAESLGAVMTGAKSASNTPTAGGKPAAAPSAKPAAKK